MYFFAQSHSILLLQVTYTLVLQPQAPIQLTQVEKHPNDADAVGNGVLSAFHQKLCRL